jgi:hypothetical protein
VTVIVVVVVVLQVVSGRASALLYSPAATAAIKAEATRRNFMFTVEFADETSTV